MNKYRLSIESCKKLEDIFITVLRAKCHTVEFMVKDCNTYYGMEPFIHYRLLGGSYSDNEKFESYCNFGDLEKTTDLMERYKNHLNDLFLKEELNCVVK